jgi:hypothetical protein
MIDIPSSPPLKASYDTIYASLNRMRQLFHQTGRFDDSNAKLDEVVKFLCIYLAFRRGLIETYPERTPQTSFKRCRELLEYGRLGVIATRMGLHLWEKPFSLSARDEALAGLWPSSPGRSTRPC